MSKHTDKDWATGKPVNLTHPEEQVRQEYEKILCTDYGYKKSDLDIGVAIVMGSSQKECDIAIYDKKRQIIGIVETKAPGKAASGEKQLTSYMSATSTCRWGVLTDRETQKCFFRSLDDGRINSNPAYGVPRRGEDGFAGIKHFNNLIRATNLKWIFRQINNLIYANSELMRKEKQGAEIVRLIFCKLVDEDDSKTNNEEPKFQIRKNENVKDRRERIEELWQSVRDRAHGESIFDPGEKIEIDDYCLTEIIAKLQGYALTETDSDVVGDAFEVFAERQFAGDKGQFFTPRLVASMIVNMVRPTKKDKIIDPACGSGGFLIAALKHISHMASREQKRGIAEFSLYGIDKDIDLSKICKAHMHIIGDGKSNVVTADSLDNSNWTNEAKSKILNAAGSAPKLFDVLITNPPFGSKIKVDKDDVLEQYDLGHVWKLNKDTKLWKKQDDTVPRPPQVLFIEKCIQLLKPKGRLGIVLPDGILGNNSDRYIRQWLLKRAKLLAVIDCPTGTFAPHTTTKTSVLILEKYEAKQSVPNGDIFMAVAENCGHTLRGDDIWENGKLREDFTEIANRYNHPSPKKSHLGFHQSKLHDTIMVPRYYDPRIIQAIKKLQHDGVADMVPISSLIAEKIISVCGVSASANSAEYDAHGDVRFIRTSDISGYELYERTQKNVSEATYQEYKETQDIQIHDILFVKDGDDKIGETAIVLDERDQHILVQTHFKKIRALKINPFLLLWMINTEIVKKQIRQRVFNQSTLSTIGSRITELHLPMLKDKSEIQNIENEMKELVTSRRTSLRGLKNLVKTRLINTRQN